VTASERQTGDADGRAGAGGNHHPLLEQRLVDVDEPRPRADRGGAGRLVHGDGVHACQVDDDSLAGRVARVAVAARSRDDADRVPARPAHRAPHVLSRLAEDDGAGTHAVVARAVETASRVVGGVLRSDDRALDELRQLDEPRVDSRSRTDSDPAGQRDRRTGAHRDPSRADDQFAPVEPLRRGVRHRVESVPCPTGSCECPAQSPKLVPTSSPGWCQTPCLRCDVPTGPRPRRAGCAGTCPPVSRASARSRTPRADA
jgi:hypothetical protein